MQMNTILRILTPTWLLIVCCLGCTTAQVNQSLITAATLASSAAEIAAQYDPEHKSAYLAAKLVFDALLKSKDYSATSFSKAISDLPGQELAGTEGVVDAKLTVYDTRTQFAYELQSEAARKATMTAIRDGLAAGLMTKSATREIRRPKPPAPIRIIPL
jgi:hypothetical protein